MHRRVFPIALVLALTACAPRPVPPGVPILLFDGTGSSPGDVAAIEAVLKSSGLAYANVDSRQLNGMSLSQLQGHRLLLFPGGNFVHMGNSLSTAAADRIHAAVKNGLNYLGICAGAFLAGNSPFHGLNLTAGVKFGFYSAENRGIRKTAVPITVPGAPTLDQYWEDGPELSGWGDVVGRYPDGKPAIVQGSSGSGWVVLSGVHAEAPESWRRGLKFATPASVDHAYAATVIRAALNREPLPHE